MVFFCFLDIFEQCLTKFLLVGICVRANPFIHMPDDSGDSDDFDKFDDTDDSDDSDDSDVCDGFDDIRGKSLLEL